MKTCAGSAADVGLARVCAATNDPNGQHLNQSALPWRWDTGDYDYGYITGGVWPVGVACFVGQLLAAMQPTLQGAATLHDILVGRRASGRMMMQIRVQTLAGRRIADGAPLPTAHLLMPNDMT